MALREYFPGLIGNDQLRARLGRDIAENRLSHAYLLIGPEGSGKHTLARQIAAALACESAGDGQMPCGECAACRAIFSGQDPDVITVSRGDRATLGVEQMRSMMEELYIAPNWHEDKIYIIEDAETMTPQAQNALLIALEEPPRHVRFFLLSTDAEAMLETVRSRALICRMGYVSPDAMRAWLTLHDTRAAALAGSNPDEFSALVLAADGSIGKALALLDSRRRKPIMSRRAAALEFLSLCLGKPDGEAVLAGLTAFPAKRDEASEVLGLAELGVRDLLTIRRARDAGLCFYTDRAAAEQTAEAVSVQALLRINDALETARASLLRNANLRMTMLTLARNVGLI